MTSSCPKFLGKNLKVQAKMKSYWPIDPKITDRKVKAKMMGYRKTNRKALAKKPSY